MRYRNLMILTLLAGIGWQLPAFAELNPVNTASGAAVTPEFVPRTHNNLSFNGCVTRLYCHNERRCVSWHRPIRGGCWLCTKQSHHGYSHRLRTCSFYEANRLMRFRGFYCHRLYGGGGFYGGGYHGRCLYWNTFRVCNRVCR